MTEFNLRGLLLRLGLGTLYVFISDLVTLIITVRIRSLREGINVFSCVCLFTGGPHVSTIPSPYHMDTWDPLP